MRKVQGSTPWVHKIIFSFLTLALHSFIKNESKIQENVKTMRKEQIIKVIKHPPGVDPWTFDSGRCSLTGPLLKSYKNWEITEIDQP